MTTRDDQLRQGAPCNDSELALPRSMTDTTRQLDLTDDGLRRLPGEIGVDDSNRDDAFEMLCLVRDQSAEAAARAQGEEVERLRARVAELEPGSSYQKALVKEVNACHGRIKDLETLTSGQRGQVEALKVERDEARATVAILQTELRQAHADDEKGGAR